MMLRRGGPSSSPLRPPPHPRRRSRHDSIAGPHPRAALTQGTETPSDGTGSPLPSDRSAGTCARSAMSLRRDHIPHPGHEAAVAVGRAQPGRRPHIPVHRAGVRAGSASRPPAPPSIHGPSARPPLRRPPFRMPPPVGTLAIDGGAGFVNGLDVTMNIAASDRQPAPETATVFTWGNATNVICPPPLTISEVDLKSGNGNHGTCSSQHVRVRRCPFTDAVLHTASPPAPTALAPCAVALGDGAASNGTSSTSGQPSPPETARRRSPHPR